MSGRARGGDMLRTNKKQCIDHSSPHISLYAKSRYLLEAFDRLVAWLHIDQLGMVMRRFSVYVFFFCLCVLYGIYRKPFWVKLGVY